MPSSSQLTLLESALAAPRVVLSVMGPHAGEDAEAIFSRKISDTHLVGWTLWLCCSPSAKPDRTQAFFSDDVADDACPVIFLAPATSGGARPTASAVEAVEFSSDKKVWKQLPSRLSPVTGRLTGSTYAFVLSELVLVPQPVEIDLWAYSDATSKPIRFMLGSSTVLAKLSDTSFCVDRMKSRNRRVVAVGGLKKPYAVWMK